MLENQQIGRSLIENGNRTSECAPTKYPDGRITNKTMENPAITSELVYL